MKRALVVDDEPAICTTLAALLTKLGCDVTQAPAAEKALKFAGEQDFDIIVMDIRLPGMDGLEALPQIRQLTKCPVLLMTAHGDLDTAVSAVKLGAFEYLTKPLSLEQVRPVLERALASKPGEANAVVAGNYESNQLLGSSPPMQHVFRQIALAAQHDEPVLITGESGSGKELIARAIHQHSDRGTKALVPVHLASLSPSLMERELFGHSAGAFTGATESQPGLIAQAGGGTLFLDEIGETPSEIQVKLLRIVETREYYPVGSTKSEVSDFRLVAATNRPVDFLRSSEDFRSDLFYRLSTIHIEAPPLRDHLEDIPAIATAILEQRGTLTTQVLSQAAVDKLQQYLFPGNVRELKNIVLRAAAQTTEESIPADLVEFDAAAASSLPGSGSTLEAAAETWAQSALTRGDKPLLGSAVEILEREVITATLKHCGGNRSAAATMLGIHRETLREKMTRLGIEPQK